MSLLQAIDQGNAPNARAQAIELDRLRDALTVSDALLTDARAQLDSLRAVNAELVAACSRSLKHYESIRGSDREDSPLMSCLRAAISKATQP